MKKVKTNFVDYIEDNILSQVTRNYMASNMSLYDYSKECGTRIPMFFNNFIVPDYINGEKTHTVKKSDINRTDWISYKYYGTPEYFWIIQLVNGIIDPYTMYVGQVLRIIPLSFIQNSILTYYDNSEELF